MCWNRFLISTRPNKHVKELLFVYMHWNMLLISQYKTQEMYGRAAQKDPYALEFVSDWLVTPKMLKEFANDEGLDNEEVDELITCCNGYE